MADIRKIKIPTPIKMAFQGQEQDYVFFAFVQHFLDTQPAYNDDAAGIKAALILDARMRDAVKQAEELSESLAAKEGAEEEAKEAKQVTELMLDEPDWQRLNAAVQNPQKLRRQDGVEVSGYPFTPARIFGDFIEAIEKAEKV